MVVTNAARQSSTIISQPAAILTFVADTDGDGIPDPWETQYFGGGMAANLNDDSDGDGMSNWKEYVAGTDPTNSASYLKVDWQGLPGSAAVMFGEISNRTYTVQYKETLASPLWLKLQDVVSQPIHRTEQIRDTNASPTGRFYRLITPVQP